MKTFIYIAALLLISTTSFAQEVLKGKVSEQTKEGKLKPLYGVNIYWVGSTTGTSTNDKGEFAIPYTGKYTKLAASLVGYKTDTLTIKNITPIAITLVASALETGSAVVTGNKQATYSDYLDAQNKDIMTEKELFKAACCNLSESFETNPSVDVTFADAITGAKQIEMLGLSGIYTQTTMENLPYFRGLLSNAGLTFVPGVWVKAINMAKGIGSVVNGFESITGQIDVDMQKPNTVDETKMLINVYGDYDRRMEGNFNYRFVLNENASAMTLLHYSRRNYEKDHNHDMFTDMPDFSVYNLMQRWYLSFHNGWESQIGFQFVKDKKNGGSVNDPVNNYNYSVDNSQFNIYGKVGYVDLENPHNSVGLQWSYNNYSTKSVFGAKNYSGKEHTGYLNFIFQSELGSDVHKYRTGVSFLFDQFDEVYLAQDFKRTEKVPGAFLEYTFTPSTEFSTVAGFRADYHNYYGTMLSPRLHVRYAPQEDWVFRLAAGRGYRTANIFAEYPSIMASARVLNIAAKENFGYGLQQESAWNYGVNLTRYFYYDYREGTVSVDFYRTQFESVVIGDLDSSPKQINIASVANGVTSNSFQVQMNFQPFERFDFRAAYRRMDVKQNINGTVLQRPLSSQNRVLVNLGYTTEQEADDDPRMVYDLTVQWFDKKRLPGSDYSPSFAVVNAQVTRNFSQFLDLYLGVENLFDYRQKDLIIDPMNPFGDKFDASIIWGPVNGRMAYAGLRFRL